MPSSWMAQPTACACRSTPVIRAPTARMGAGPRVKRWHPTAEDWEDPDKALPEGDAAKQAERLVTDDRGGQAAAVNKQRLEPHPAAIKANSNCSLVGAPAESYVSTAGLLPLLLREISPALPISVAVAIELLTPPCSSRPGKVRT